MPNKIGKVFLRILILFSVPFVINILIVSYFSYKHVTNSSTLFLIIIFLIIGSFVKETLNKIIIFTWYGFYFCGLLFLNSATTWDSKLRISNNEADNFYFLCLISLSFGFIVSEKIFSDRKKNISIKKEVKLNRVFLTFILLFPFFFFVSVFSSVGFVPMLLGDSIVSEMYAYNYGPLYGYKYIIIISILTVVFYYISSGQKKVYIFLVIIYAVISLIDGKRIVLLIAAFAGILLYYLYTNKYTKTNMKLIFSIVFITSIMYSGLSTLRAGKDNDLVSIDMLIKKFPFGVEYVDYVYSFQTYKPGSIKNYNFLESSIGAFMNSTILSLFGYDKLQMVRSGSAHTWMRLYDIDLGIRTGIFSELYFDYGFWTILIVFFMAFYFDYINRKIFQKTDLFSFFLLLSLFGFNVMLIVGQATVYTGSATLMLYLYVFYKLTLLLYKKPRFSRQQIRI